MRITIRQCCCAALAVFVLGGCAAKPTPPASSSAEGAAPGAMPLEQQQAMIQQRTEAARNGGLSGAMKSGRPMSLETYRMMMDHMTAQQKVEFAQKHRSFSVVPSSPPAPQ